MSKAAKVPVMRQNQTYTDWRKELQVWQVTNATIGVDNKTQAGTLFLSLEGLPRQTVLSELTVAEITHEDGIDNILQTLDNFYMGNETKNAFAAIDELLQYKCNRDDTMEQFIIQFQLIVNRVKASGTKLSEGILGYTLLSSANLSEEKQDMVKATCDVVTFRKVKAQLEKIGFGKSRSNSRTFTTDPKTSSVKLETFYGEKAHLKSYYDQSGSSDEDLNGEQVLYSESKNPIARQSQGKFKLNPPDRFGHARPCTYCKCLYHWLIDCPYAPDSVKSNLRSKRTSYSSTSKPL